MQDDDNIKVAKRLVYDQICEFRKSALELQGQYGKWLISSLLLANGAAIGYIAGNETLSAKLIPVVFYWPVVGLFLALASGFSAWMNLGLLFDMHYEVNPRMLFDDKAWPDHKSDPRNKWVEVTRWSAVLLGIASAACIVIATVITADVMAP